jgi:putative membrane protein
MAFCVISVCMAISAIYELLEWAAALVSAEAAESFLGTQGDGWDTQSDMFCALIGATFAVTLLRIPHDKSWRRIASAMPNNHNQYT